MRGMEPDGRDVEVAEEQTESSPELGITKEQRVATVVQARTVCWVLNGVTVACALWVWLYPRPYELAVMSLALLPWVAIYVTARYRGVVALNQEKRGDPHPTSFFAFMVPSMALMALASRDIILLGVWQDVAIPVVLVAVILTGAVYLADKATQQHPIAAFALLMFALLYGYGVVMEANALFDRSQPRIYETTVAWKSTTHRRGTSYHLALMPWGPMTNGSNVTVTEEFYYAVEERGPVCVMLHKGAFSVAWYQVRTCE